MNPGSQSERDRLNGESRAAIRAERLSKTFRLPHEARNTVREYALHPFRRTTYETQRALDDVSFEIPPGEFFGVIGRNGSGKSTLLKLLAGIYQPDSGTVDVHGKLSPFIELGVGFNPELNARDNIKINGTLLGLTGDELEERFDEIVGFAELERFVDQKLKNYSSGMQLRLAYSIAIQVPFDILLLDEVLAVGDQNFQEKCFATFDGMRASGKTVVLVTHSLPTVTRFCERALLLRDGVVQTVGEPAEIIDVYLRQERERAEAAANGRASRRDALRATIGTRTEGAIPPARQAASRGALEGSLQTLTREEITLMAPAQIEDLIRSQQARLAHRAEQLLTLEQVRGDLTEARREVGQLTKMIKILLARHYASVPLPPEELRARMSTRSSEVNYLAQGLLASDKAVHAFGESPSAPILEWGCGTGRTLRWLTCYPAWREKYRGCDTDTEAIEWAVADIGVGDLRVCGSHPPLPYAEGSLGGVFALAMLTHIHPREHRAWFSEFRRILEPGGVALIGTQGPSQLPPAAGSADDGPARAFKDNGWAHLQTGSGPGAAFVSDAFTRDASEGFLSIVEYQPRGHGLTDTYLLTRVD